MSSGNDGHSPQDRRVPSTSTPQENDDGHDGRRASLPQNQGRTQAGRQDAPAPSNLAPANQVSGHFPPPSTGPSDSSPTKRKAKRNESPAETKPTESGSSASDPQRSFLPPIHGPDANRKDPVEKRAGYPRGAMAPLPAITSVSASPARAGAQEDSLVGRPTSGSGAAPVPPATHATTRPAPVMSPLSDDALGAVPQQEQSSASGPAEVAGTAIFMPASGQQRAASASSGGQPSSPGDGIGPRVASASSTGGVLSARSRVTVDGRQNSRPASRKSERVVRMSRAGSHVASDGHPSFGGDDFSDPEPPAPAHPPKPAAKKTMARGAHVGRYGRHIRPTGPTVSRPQGETRHGIDAPRPAATASPVASPPTSNHIQPTRTLPHIDGLVSSPDAEIPEDNPPISESMSGRQRRVEATVAVTEATEAAEGARGRELAAEEAAAAEQAAWSQQVLEAVGRFASCVAADVALRRPTDVLAGLRDAADRVALRFSDEEAELETLEQRCSTSLWASRFDDVVAAEGAILKVAEAREEQRRKKERERIAAQTAQCVKPDSPAGLTATECRLDTTMSDAGSMNGSRSATPTRNARGRTPTTKTKPGRDAHNSRSRSRGRGAGARSKSPAPKQNDAAAVSAPEQQAHYEPELTAAGSAVMAPVGAAHRSMIDLGSSTNFEASGMMSARSTTMGAGAMTTMLNAFRSKLHLGNAGFTPAATARGSAFHTTDRDVRLGGRGMTGKGPGALGHTAEDLLAVQATIPESERLHGIFSAVAEGRAEAAAVAGTGLSVGGQQLPVPWWAGGEKPGEEEEQDAAPAWSSAGAGPVIDVPMGEPFAAAREDAALGQLLNKDLSEKLAGMVEPKRASPIRANRALSLDDVDDVDLVEHGRRNTTASTPRGALDSARVNLSGGNDETPPPLSPPMVPPVIPAVAALSSHTAPDRAALSQRSAMSFKTYGSTGGGGAVSPATIVAFLDNAIDRQIADDAAAVSEFEGRLMRQTFGQAAAGRVAGLQQSIDTAQCLLGARKAVREINQQLALCHGLQSFAEFADIGDELSQSRLDLSDVGELVTSRNDDADSPIRRPPSRADHGKEKDSGLEFPSWRTVQLRELHDAVRALQTALPLAMRNTPFCHTLVSSQRLAAVLGRTVPAMRQLQAADPCIPPAAPHWQKLLGLGEFTFDHERAKAIKQAGVYDLPVGRVLELLHHQPAVALGVATDPLLPLAGEGRAPCRSGAADTRG